MTEETYGLTLEAFAEIARSLAAASGTDEVMAHVAERLVRHTRATGAYVERVINSDREVMVSAAVGERLPAVGTIVAYPGSLTEEIIENGSPSLATEIDRIGRAVAPYLAESCVGCSVLIVPLSSQDRILGALVLLCDDSEHFDDDEVALARTLGDLTSVSLRRVLLLEESEGRRRELEISEQRLRLLVDSVRDYAIIMLDPEGRVLSWTRAAEKISGYSRDEMLGSHYTILHDPDTPENNLDRELEFAARDGRFETEGWRRRKDGTRYWAHVTTSAVRDGEGGLAGFAKVAQDLTERRMAENALRDSEARFRSMAENATEAIITIDLNDRVLFANPGVAEIFGYSEEELIGSSFTRLIPERLRRDHLRGLTRFATTREANIPWDGIELPGLRKDGTEVPLEVTFSFYEQNGEIFFSGIMRDITSRLQLADAQVRLLQEEQAARHQAEEAAHARERVLGIVSHDLRNPLNTIVMSASLLSDTMFEGLTPETVDRQLRIIKRSADRMNRMIQDLLDVTRIESGTLAVNAEPVSADMLAREACELIQPLLIDKSQVFSCDLSDPLPIVNADRDRIHQVISNLAGNAVKFTGEGGKVELRARQVDGSVEFAVVDNGSGIPNDDLPHLFNAHWQAKQTAHLGAGLGLAIARGIIEAHGGRIWVESEEGQGSRFFFTIPVPDPAETGAAA